MAQWTSFLDVVSHSILWLCRNGQKAIQFLFSEGGNLIIAVQSALRDGLHHGNFLLYQTCQVGSCFQDTPVDFTMYSLHLLSLHKPPHRTAIFCNWADKNVKEMAHQGWLWMLHHGNCNISLQHTSAHDTGLSFSWKQLLAVHSTTKVK